MNPPSRWRWDRILAWLAALALILSILLLVDLAERPLPNQ